MLTIRFITAGAALVVAVGAAAAQGGDTAGRPVPLLQVLSQPTATTTTTTTVTTTTAPNPHARVAHRHPARRVAKKSHEDAEQTEPTEQTEQTGQDATAPSAAAPTAAAPTVAPTAFAPSAVAPLAANVWTAAGATPLPGVATDATAPTVIPTVDQNLSAVVVGGHTVQISSPDEFNTIDLAADRQSAPAADTPAAPAVAVAEPDDHARDVWYEELLATLGGALAAGVVAWFLVVGGSQQRMYG
jgi:hypothetical protein